MTKRHWSKYLGQGLVVDICKLYTYEEAMSFEDDIWRLPTKEDFNNLQPPSANSEGLFIKTYRVIKGKVKEETTFFTYNDILNGVLYDRKILTFWLGRSVLEPNKEPFLVADHIKIRFLEDDISQDWIFKPTTKLLKPVVLVRRANKICLTEVKVNGLIFIPHVLGYSIGNQQGLTFTYNEALKYKRNNWEIPTIKEIESILFNAKITESYGCYGEKCYVLEYNNKHLFLPKNTEIQRSIGSYYEDCLIWLRTDKTPDELCVLSIFTTGVGETQKIKTKRIEYSSHFPCLFGAIPKAGILLVKRAK